MSTAGIEFIREEISGMAWDKYDPWACVKEAQFDIAEAWYGYADACLPGFNPTPVFQNDDWETERSERLYGAMKDGIISLDDVYYWWGVLDRMEGLIVAAGRSY